jgi:hypothetical protein
MVLLSLVTHYFPLVGVWLSLLFYTSGGIYWVVCDHCTWPLVVYHGHYQPRLLTWGPPTIARKESRLVLRGVAMYLRPDFSGQLVRTRVVWSLMRDLRDHCDSHPVIITSMWREGLDSGDSLCTSPWREGLDSGDFLCTCVRLECVQ